MKKSLFVTAVFLAAIAVSGCTRPDATVSMLESQGYTEVDITGYNFFGCSKDDSFHTGWTATSVTGARVEGVACAGLFKGTTIRQTRVISQ